jgi:hypothetical protein
MQILEFVLTFRATLSIQAALAATLSANTGSGGGNSAQTAAAAAAAAMAATRSFLEKLNSSHALNPPPQIELRDFGVWAKENVSAGTRYGPFLGKWALEPTNQAYAWEVSEHEEIEILVKNDVEQTLFYLFRL